MGLRMVYYYSNNRCKYQRNTILFPSSQRKLSEYHISHLNFDLFSEDEDYTFTEKYEKEFFWQFCVYWFAIPFYIPCVFFTSALWMTAIGTICVFFAPQLVYFIYDISNDIKNAKEYRIKEQKRAQELKEQELREELGQ